MDLVQSTPLVHKTVELYSEGKTPKDIASTLGLSTAEVVRTLSQPNVKKMIDDTITSIGNAIVAKNIALMDKIIQAKLEKIEKGDGTLADATKKDIVDLMKVVADISIAKEKLEKDDNSNTYINILNGILK